MLSTSSNTLEAVLDQFSHWRKNKSHAREAIPEKLWYQAITLYPEYSQKRICQILHLNTSAFSTHRQKYQKRFQETDEANPQQTFVEVKPQTPLERPSHQHNKNLPILEFERADGCKLRLFEGQGISALSLIEGFLKGSDAATDTTDSHFPSC